MIAQEALPIEVRYHRLEVQNHWLLGIGTVILLALIALGGWVALDRFALTGNAAKVEPWIDAVTGDSLATFQSLYAPNAQILSPETNGQVWGYGDLQDIYGQTTTSGLTLERTGAIETFGPFVTFHLNFANDLGYEGTATATFQYNEAGLITAESIFVDY